MPADLIVTNARIYTVDAGNPTAEALAVRDGRFLAVGPRAGVGALAGRGTTLVDLGGRTVIPGLIDAHVHLLQFALGLHRVQLADVATLDEAVAKVSRAASRLQPGDWVLGGGFDSNSWGRLPTRWELDSVAPTNPVLLLSKDMHSGWASSLALARAGVDRDTPNPPGGEIVRDPVSGEPTGILREGAVPLVARLAGMMADDPGGQPPGLAPLSPEGCECAFHEALRIAASRGLTGLHTPEGPLSFAVLQQLHARGRLHLRIWSHLRCASLPDALRLGLRTGFGDDWLRVGQLKLFLDGALGSQTDHTLEPHLESGSRGIETMSREEVKGMVAAAAKGGIAAAIHAIGDAANRVALDVLDETAQLWRPAGLRPRIEHVQLLHPNDAGRLGRLGVVASMQPGHQPSDWAMADRFWGPTRTPLAYAWRTVQDSGAVLAFGSDCPVEPIDPFLGLHAAVTRQTPDGEPRGGWHPEQRLTPLEALRAYTLGPAYASGEERVKGSITPGKLADFAVLSLDPFAGPPELLLRTEVLATVVGGRVLHGEL